MAKSAESNQFCQYCHQPLEKFQTLFDDFSEIGYKHAPDVHALLESARQGCRLCTMLVNNMSERTRDWWMTIPQQLYMRPRLEKGCRPGCTQIDLTILNGAPGNTLPVSLHRHQRAIEEKLDYQEENGIAIQTSTGSDQVFTTIIKWLQKCQSSHEDCNMVPGIECGRPNRLLELDAFIDSPDIKLVDGADTGPSPYATLSYRRGGPSSVMLQTTNIDDFRVRIDWSKLPKTMRDAVTVCRKLAVRYLWIDALCIIQGADDDFSTQASQMEAAYAGSVFTVAAAQSENSDGGCFRDVSPLNYIVSQDSDYTVFLKARTPCMALDNLPGNCPLDLRGWVYQERMMSPRTLLFGKEGIHWECRKGVICCSEPDFERPHFPGWVRPIPTKHQYIKIRSLEANSRPEDAMQQFQRWWTSVIDGYSRTKLSFVEDKLIAIAGLASVVQQKLKIEASFGLWLPFILDDLLWEVALPELMQEDRETEPTENKNEVSVSFPGIPSWSWASTNARVSFLHEPKPGTRRPIRNVEKLYSAILLVSPPPTPFIRLDALVAQHSTPPSVRIRGPLSKCRALPYQAKPRVCGFNLEPDRPISEAERPKSCLEYKGTPPQTHLFANHYNNVIKRGKVACAFQPDFPITKPIDSLVCILIKRVRYQPYDRLVAVRDVGLVLQPTSAEKMQYRRVGIYTEERPDNDALPSFMFPAAVEEEVEIV